MKKLTIGFSAKAQNETEVETPKTPLQNNRESRKSVVEVFFPARGRSWTYYNESFDLKVGNFVYVEGQLEGLRGQITKVNYSFKIKPSDYKKIIAVIDTSVQGSFFLAGSHLVSFDKAAIPFAKVLTWFKAPDAEEYISGNDDSESFPLSDLGKMHISHNAASCGHEYYTESRVSYMELDGTCGRAIVEGSENYELEFSYSDGIIADLKCSCFCSGACKHEFAAILQLKETLDLIKENYTDEYKDYFATISKGVFMNTVMNKKTSGKINLDV